jgi:hypothetical protein
MLYLYRHLQENVFVSIYISKIVLVMIEYRIKTILKCNKADPDGTPLPTGGLWCHGRQRNLVVVACMKFFSWIAFNKSLKLWKWPHTASEIFPLKSLLYSPTAFFRLAVAVGRQRALHTENSGFASPTLGRHISTFRGYRILFSIRNPYINEFLIAPSRIMCFVSYALPRYNWNIVERGIKHHKPKPVLDVYPSTILFLKNKHLSWYCIGGVMVSVLASIAVDRGCIKTINLVYVASPLSMQY